MLSVSRLQYDRNKRGYMTLGADRQYGTVLALSENYASDVLPASESDGYRQARNDSMQKAI